MLRTLKTIMSFIFIFLLTPLTVQAEPKNQYIVGYYEYEPYFYLDEQGKVNGLYHDILKILEKDLGVEFIYHTQSLNSIVDLVNDGELDLLIGMHFTEERADKLLYSELPVGTQRMAIYTNEKIVYGDLEKLEDMRFALIESERNSDYIERFLEVQDISVNKEFVSTYHDAVQLLLLESVDATIATPAQTKLQGAYKVYEYSAGPVYFAASHENKELIELIDEQLMRYENQNNNPIKALEELYFPDKELIEVILIKLIVAALLLFSINIFIYPKIKYKFKKKQLRDQISNGNFVPFYQPIVNPQTNEVIGYEALLRRYHPKKGLQSPYFFINELEDYHMLPEITLWLIKKVIEDYKVMQTFEGFEGRSFYVSINVSIAEVEDESFVWEVINLLKKSNLPKQSLCLEVVEKYKISDVSKMRFGLELLSVHGYKLALDDFGVEYSNLNVLDLYEFNVIKLDKYFADEYKQSKIVRYLIEFLAQLGQVGNDYIILEGIETEEQKEAIKALNHPNIYIQGYYYAKPMPLDDLQTFKIETV